jgi:hypothetical protein
MLNWLSQRISINWLKAVITVVALGVIVLRIYYPDVRIDAVTFGLFVVAILPWLSELIESAKFPGGWEVKFRDVREAGAKVTSSSPPLPLPRHNPTNRVLLSWQSTIPTLHSSGYESRSRSVFVGWRASTISTSVAR